MVTDAVAGPRTIVGSTVMLPGISAPAPAPMQARASPSSATRMV